MKEVLNITKKSARTYNIAYNYKTAIGYVKK